MFPLRSNVFVATNLHWNPQDRNSQDWNQRNMDLTAFYRMHQRNSLLPYLPLYQPYNNFLMASDRSYFEHITSRLNSYPIFNYYMCLDAKNLYASLFGKHHTYLLKHCTYFYERYCAVLTNNIKCFLMFPPCLFEIVRSPWLNFSFKKISRETIIYCNFLVFPKIFYKSPRFKIFRFSTVSNILVTTV